MKFRRIMKVVLCMCLVLGMSIMFFGCGNSSEKTEAPQKQEVSKANNSTSDNGKSTEKEEIFIGVAMQGYTGIFCQYIAAGIMDSVSKMDDVKVTFVDATNKADKQVTQVENYIAQDVDAIILNPVDKEASCVAVDAAIEANIPIITVNTQTTNQEEADAYAGSDDVEAGEIQMQYIADKLDGKGNVVILHGAMGHSAQVARRIGYMNIIDKYPDLCLLYEQSADWQTDKAMAIMENWLQTGKQIDAVATNCDTMAVGAQIAIDAVDKTGEIMVMGMDAIPDVMQSIKDGIIAGTIWQDGIGQGVSALDLAIRAANGENVDDVIIPFELVIKDNIGDYEAKAQARDALNEKYKLK